MRPVAVAPLLALTLSLGGCTAILSTARVMEAQRAVRTARDKEAPVLATYEFTMAVENLDKAIEESADAQHRRAVQLARTSRGWAEAAVIRIDGGAAGRTVGNPEEELQDVVAPPIDRSALPPEPEAPPEADTDDLGDFLEEEPEDDEVFGEESEPARPAPAPAPAPPPPPPDRPVWSSP